MKTPSYRTEDWHLDNYNNSPVTIVFNDGSTQSVMLKDSDTRGLFVEHGEKKHKETWYVPSGSYKRLVLPDLPREDGRKNEEGEGK